MLGKARPQTLAGISLVLLLIIGKALNLSVRKRLLHRLMEKLALLTREFEVSSDSGNSPVVRRALEAEESKGEEGSGVEKRCIIRLMKKTPIQDPDFLKALKKDREICALKRKIEENYIPDLQYIAAERRAHQREADAHRRRISFGKASLPVIDETEVLTDASARFGSD